MDKHYYNLEVKLNIRDKLSNYNAYNGSYFSTYLIDVIFLLKVPSFYVTNTTNVDDIEKEKQAN